jgi:hypothetical protein
MRWFHGSEAPHSDLQLTFRCRQVPRFTITQLLFWNAGNQAIRSADFAKASQFRIEFPGTLQLFDAKITAVSARETAVTLGEAIESPEASTRTIPIGFDYFDRGDGFILQLIHDGDSHRGIRFAGKLLGVASLGRSSPPLNTAPDFESVQREWEMMMPFFPWISMTFFLVLGCIGAWNIYYAVFDQFHWYRLVGALPIFFLVLPIALCVKRRPPKKLYDALTARPTSVA